MEQTLELLQKAKTDFNTKADTVVDDSCNG